MRYTPKVMEHFRNPRNVGKIDNADGIGEIGNPADGDLVKIYIKVENDILKEVTFQTFGCVAAIATSSKVTEMAKGLTIDDALKITKQDVADALDGLPPQKMHCSNLGADALHLAIKQYLKKKKREDAQEPEDEIQSLLKSPQDILNDFEKERNYENDSEIILYLQKKFKDNNQSNIVDKNPKSVKNILDLRKKQCPMTFVFTKVALETNKFPDNLIVLLDFPPAFTNVPQSVKKQNLGEVISKIEEKIGNKNYFIIEISQKPPN